MLTKGMEVRWVGRCPSLSKAVGSKASDQLPQPPHDWAALHNERRLPGLLYRAPLSHPTHVDVRLLIIWTVNIVPKAPS